VLVRLAVVALVASASVTGVVPNTASDGDAGEFVTVEFEEPTNTSNWVLADGETTASLPNRTVSGTVALSTDPGVARNRTEHPVLTLQGRLSLSNSGEWVALRAGEQTVDNLTYPSAPTAQRWTGAEWVPLGATDFRPFVAENVTVSSFTLPDDPEQPLAAVRGATDRLYLAGYTLTSKRVTRALVHAADRGVDVRVLVEGGVAGGVPAAEATRLDRLTDAGVDVRVVDGERARYSFHHPKYAVADDTAVVLSENWKPSGTGGHGSRGWGVTVHDAPVADHLAAVFRADAGWADAKPWGERRPNLTLVDSEPASETFPTRFPALQTDADRVRVLLAPDNARRGVQRLLASANESLLVEQVRLAENGSFTNWTIDAARRGVRVRILLSNAWYVATSNRNTTQRLNRIAAEENLDLRASLVDPRSRFEKVHVKGAVVDGERALVGSLNWNEHAATENREVVVVVEDREVADYYERAFRADWRGGAWRLPVGLGGVVTVVATLGVLCASRVEFRGEEQ
jgi:phosphatidylserine/phosphatidylglycerophosphate/cardiolipin synthase-like enzyme